MQSKPFDRSVTNAPPDRLYLGLLSISPPSSVDNVEYYNLGENRIDNQKDLVKVFIHLAIHTSFIDLRKCKNTNWTIVLNI